MKLLSLDISTASTGWCFFDGGCFNIGTIPINNKLDNTKMLCIFANALKELLEKYQPDYIVQEDIFSGKNVKTMKILCEFSGVSKYICYTVAGVNPIIVSNKTVKSYFKAIDKKTLFCFVCKIFDKELVFKNDNDKVDALAQLIYFMDIVLNKRISRIEKSYGYIYCGGNLSVY